MTCKFPTDELVEALSEQWAGLHAAVSKDGDGIKPGDITFRNVSTSVCVLYGVGAGDGSKMSRVELLRKKPSTEAVM